MRFRLKTLNTVDVDTDTLAYWEICAFFKGAAQISELAVDRDLAIEWYIDHRVNPDLREDYRAEKQMAEDEALESFSSALSQLSAQRSESFGANYPFDFISSTELARKSIEQLSPVSLCYLILQLFRLYQRGLIEVESATSRSQQFERSFRNIFEYVAGYAVSTRKSGIPLMTSSSRSAKRLHAILSKLCRMLGSGSVLSLDQWNTVQQETNDGGVDCIIHVGKAREEGDASILLVGATVQKDNIQQKILGPQARDSFGKFFRDKPAVFHSVLVRPWDEDALTKEKCIQFDCMLISYPEIVAGLAATKCDNMFWSNYRRLDAEVWEMLRALADYTYIDDYQEYACPAGTTEL